MTRLLCVIAWFLVLGLMALCSCGSVTGREGTDARPTRHLAVANEPDHQGAPSSVSPSEPATGTRREFDLVIPSPVAPIKETETTKESPGDPQESQVETTTVPTPEQEEAPVPLSIEFFRIVEALDPPAGKQITFEWASNGVWARIMSGTKRRLQDWWVVPPRGALTIVAASTVYRDPVFTLHVHSTPLPEGIQSGQVVSASVGIPWPCEPDYFFSNSLQRCPLGPPVISWAAEQPFEGGWMLWLETERSIYVFTGVGDLFDGRFLRYADAWTEDELSYDPSLAAPPGLHQPTRGFGKVWREELAVQGVLGWATAPESGYETIFQQAHHEGSSSGAPRYLRRMDGRIIWLFGDRVGSWGLVGGQVKAAER